MTLHSSKYVLISTLLVAVAISVALCWTLTSAREESSEPVRLVEDFWVMALSGKMYALRDSVGFAPDNFYAQENRCVPIRIPRESRGDFSGPELLQLGPGLTPEERKYWNSDVTRLAEKIFREQAVSRTISLVRATSSEAIVLVDFGQKDKLDRRWLLLAKANGRWIIFAASPPGYLAKMNPYFALDTCDSADAASTVGKAFDNETELLMPSVCDRGL